jgi:hypothetical protein
MDIPPSSFRYMSSRDTIELIELTSARLLPNASYLPRQVIYSPIPVPHYMTDCAMT